MSNPVINKRNNESRSVFGIPIEGFGVEEILSRIRASWRGPIWIVTANPEILLFARSDEAYAAVLRQADIRTVDGFGLWLCLRLAGQKTERVTGVHLSESILREAAKNHWRVALIGGGEGVAQTAADRLKKRYPDLNVHAEQGGSISLDGTDDDCGEEARHRLTFFDPQILLVAFGHPRQERWIQKHAHAFPNAKAVIGVGGTLDFWAGIAKRAPRSFQILGLEWLWRLVREPRRWKRIWNAVAVFPIRFVQSRLA